MPEQTYFESRERALLGARYDEVYRPQGEVRAAEQEFAPAAAAPKRTKMNRRKRNEYIWGWVFITPLTVGFLLFTAFPLVLSIFYSFTSYDLFHAPEWIWFDNFIEIFTSPTDWFLESLVNALIYTIGVPLGAAKSIPP